MPLAARDRSCVSTASVRPRHESKVDFASRVDLRAWETFIIRFPQKIRKAQQFFDQGLKLVYGFNHDEARRSFQRAAELDPKLAMAWWGVALTLGPNYNLPVDPEREKAGYDAVQQRGRACAKMRPKPERAYIDALAVRYSNDPKADLHALDLAYKDAMHEGGQRVTRTISTQPRFMPKAR